MSIVHYGGGLAKHPGYLRDKVAIFFDDSYHLIEAPTRWMMNVAKRSSRSEETSRNYANILNRYLQWLDDAGYGCQSWQMVDEDIFDAFLLYLCQSDQDKNRRLQHKTILHYASRVHDFYAWANRYGYPHHLEIEANEIEHKLQNQLLLAHVKASVTVAGLNFNLPAARPTLHEQELDKFVVQSDFEAALSLMSDVVFQVIALIIRTLGLRPKDLLQIPYRGKDENSGFIPYDTDEIPDDLDNRSIFYFFESKGKHRSIQFPGKLWRIICEHYIPLRRQRAEIFREKYNVSPPNSALFLTNEGAIVTYPILYYHFNKVVEESTKLPVSGKKYKGRKFTACMLRHSCATYFVYEALKRRNQLGHSFVYDAALDEELRKIFGHNDVKTTLEYYVHLVNRFVHDDLLQDLRSSQIDAGLTAFLEARGY